MHKGSPRISRALFGAALALLLLSCYELATRLDAMWGPLHMFVDMAVGERIPLKKVLAYVDARVFETPLYMLMCALLALWALISRRGRRACAFMLLPCAALTAIGFTLRLTLFGEMVRTLKMLPLVGVLLLCLAQVLVRPRPQKRPAPPARETAPPPVPLQPLQPVQQRHRRSERRRAS